MKRLIFANQLTGEAINRETTMTGLSGVKPFFTHSRCGNY
jgi:hypothetical protein